MEITRERRELIHQRLRQATIAANGREFGMATFLANEVGVSASTAAKWLNGKVTPESDRWGVIAAALGVSASWLVGADHDTPSHLVNTDRAVADKIGKVSTIVHPLVYKIYPRCSEEQLAELSIWVYEKLTAGEPENAVAGDVAKRLLDMAE